MSVPKRTSNGLFSAYCVIDSHVVGCGHIIRCDCTTLGQLRLNVQFERGSKHMAVVV